MQLSLNGFTQPDPDDKKSWGGNYYRKLNSNIA